MKSIARYLLCLLVISGVTLAQSPDIILARLLGNARLVEARDYITMNHDRLIQDETVAQEGPPARSKRLFESLRLKEIAVDEYGNVSAIRQGRDEGAFIAVMALQHATSAVTSMAAIARAIDAAGITTRTNLLFVTVYESDDTNDAIHNVRGFFENSAYKDRIRSCIVIQPSAENTVFGPPSAIGSTIVQYGWQSVGAYSAEPAYSPASGILELPIQLRIPAVGMGVGEGVPGAKALQIVMTAVLALAGV